MKYADAHLWGFAEENWVRAEAGKKLIRFRGRQGRVLDGNMKKIPRDEKKLKKQEEKRKKREEKQKEKEAKRKKREADRERKAEQREARRAF